MRWCLLRASSVRDRTPRPACGDYSQKGASIKRVKRPLGYDCECNGDFSPLEGQIVSGWPTIHWEPTVGLTEEHSSAKTACEPLAIPPGGPASACIPR